MINLQTGIVKGLIIHNPISSSFSIVHESRDQFKTTLISKVSQLTRLKSVLVVKQLTESLHTYKVKIGYS